MAERTSCLRDGALSGSVYDKIRESKVFMVGAGGIGCELLKNLVLSGFRDIHIIDLDTIDVSNLNRQFLFRKEHVGKSKAVIARESALRFNPNVNIVAHHGNVKSTEFGVRFFKQFSLVFNALDNVSARRHVNRMCLAAEIPLIESGSGGYAGQVTVIMKNKSECYECNPKPAPKQHAVCTIRNTPSAPVHCVVWAKFLFQQLFGRADDENDVSPDMVDPEAANEDGTATAAPSNEHTTLRTWAHEQQFDPETLFDRLFHHDVASLLAMERLWQRRRKPSMLCYHDALSLEETGASDAPETSKSEKDTKLTAQRLWTMRECAQEFVATTKRLRERFVALESEYAQKGSDLGEVALDWDKDDVDALRFVCAASNLRSRAFGIPTKSLFDVKSIAGNIIPAIATVNAMVAGLVVIEAIKILTHTPSTDSSASETSANVSECRTTYLTRQPNRVKRLLLVSPLYPPNKNCFVCSRHELSVTLNLNQMQLGNFAEKVLKERLNMNEPELMKGGTILVSCEEEDESGDERKRREGQLLKTFNSVGVCDGEVLAASDALQDLDLNISIIHSEELCGSEFLFEGEVPEAKRSATATTTATANETDVKVDSDDELCEVTTVVRSKKRKSDDESTADGGVVDDKGATVITVKKAKI